MADDIVVDSDASLDSSSEDEVPSMLEIPDTVTYRFPRTITEVEPELFAGAPGERKLHLKVNRCSDKVCGYGSFGDTRVCCVVMTPVHEADVEDFEAGVAVKVSGAPYVNEMTLRDLIMYMIPSNRLKRTFIDVKFSVYSDQGSVVPVALMTAMFVLSASRIDVKGVVTSATVFVDSDGNLTSDPGRELEQKARDKTTGCAYVTVMKIMRDDHVRWYDMEGIPKAKNLKLALQQAASDASAQYTNMSKMLKTVAEQAEKSDLSLA